MKVHEFIEWLKTQDQDAEVRCISHTNGTGYYDQGGSVEIKDFDSTPSCSDNNFNQDFESFSLSDGSKYLLIGSVGN